MKIFNKLISIFKKALRDNLLAGLLFLMPLVATFYFIHFLIVIIDKIWLVLPRALRPENFLPFPVPGLGIILVFTILLLSGFFVRNFLGRKLVELGEKIMSYIPFVSKVYYSVKQLVETIFYSQGKEFKQVVLVEFPRRNTYVLAYVTGVASGEIQRKTDKRMINLFVPTTPNPTSGYYVIVPETEIIPLDMTVEDSFKVLMSGGILTPEKVRSKAKSNESSPGEQIPKEDKINDSQ